jgi:dolichol-phosphate mannosyltransferase
LTGILLLALGIMGAYIARIYDEAKGRPLYVVASTRGFPDSAK